MGREVETNDWKLLILLIHAISRNVQQDENQIHQKLM